MAQPTTPVVENSNGTLAVIAGIMRGYFQAWKLEREIDALGSSEAARVLGEAGLDRADFLARPTRRTPMDDLLLETGMEACGIDREHLRAREPGWLRDMERTCMRSGAEPLQESNRTRGVLPDPSRILSQQPRPGLRTRIPVVSLTRRKQRSTWNTFTLRDLI